MIDTSRARHSDARTNVDGGLGGLAEVRWNAVWEVTQEVRMVCDKNRMRYQRQGRIRQSKRQKKDEELKGDEWKQTWGELGDGGATSTDSAR